MGKRFPEGANNHLVNLLTIATQDGSAESTAAFEHELLNGSGVLLVAAEPAPGGGRGVTFTHAPVIDGQVTLFAFTGEAAVRNYAKEDMTFMIFPSGAFFRSCMKNGVGAIVVDPNTPNEVRIGLTPPQDGPGSRR